MCAILDADMYGRFLNPQNADMEPVRDWMNKHGKMAYSPTSRMEAELRRSPRMEKKFLEYSRAGKLKRFDKIKVSAFASKLESEGLRTNDSHIVALAECGNVKLLVSEDKMLHRDFKKKARGKVYQYKAQKHLLRKDTCS